MLGGLTACLITRLEGGPIEALANEVVVGNWQVGEQGQASSNFKVLASSSPEANLKIYGTTISHHASSENMSCARISKH